MGHSTIIGFCVPTNPADPEKREFGAGIDIVVSIVVRLAVHHYIYVKVVQIIMTAMNTALMMSNGSMNSM